MLQFLHFLLDASGEGNHCHAKENNQVDLKFALPGKKRQDSVYSLLQILLRFLRRCTLKVKGTELLVHLYYHNCSMLVKISPALVAIRDGVLVVILKQ
ncbi:uncharacterized protein LOC132615113 isoform X6 [Lycium barbarum]|uniref:uncharacterized protein LOC132615113 isoform X6 n=1 Tax=Lycium barbarum TaxID=112863 RepID=UPI00293F4181|nr:uncharacterized protein LOC132615113 isoform X6 [Lycium barbarum]